MALGWDYSGIPNPGIFSLKSRKRKHSKFEKKIYYDFKAQNPTKYKRFPGSRQDLFNFLTHTVAKIVDFPTKFAHNPMGLGFLFVSPDLTQKRQL